jgi:hypothetical protein
MDLSKDEIRLITVVLIPAVDILEILERKQSTHLNVALCMVLIVVCLLVRLCQRLLNLEEIDSVLVLTAFLLCRIVGIIYEEVVEAIPACQAHPTAW